MQVLFKATEIYNEDDSTKIAELLIGRKIVRAENFDTYDYPQGRLTLDDGTILYLSGNEGGCSCSSGDYFLERVATVDNIITNAWVHCSPDYDDYDVDGIPGEGVYRIYVIADNKTINVAEFEGSDGNGYYGTGFSIAVVRPEQSTSGAVNA